MKTKHRLSELKTQRNLYVDYLRSNEDPSKVDDVILNMDDTLGLCGEITRIEFEIKRLENLPLKFAEKEIDFYGVEFPSSINKVYQPAPTAKKSRAKKTRQMPNIPSTWSRAM